MAMPTLTYGSKAWGLKQKCKNKIETAEMRFLSGVKECVRNNNIRKGLNTYKVQDKTNEYKRNIG